MGKRERRKANSSRKQERHSQVRDEYDSRNVALERLNSNDRQHQEPVRSHGRRELVNYVTGDCTHCVVDKFIPGDENTAKLTLVESLMQSIANGETEDIIPIKELADIDHQEIDLLNGGEN